LIPKDQNFIDTGDKMEFQTRSDNPEGKYGGINLFDSLNEAYQAAQIDNSIWKISYTAKDGSRHRWRRYIEEGAAIWSDEPMLIDGIEVSSPSIQKMTDEEFARLAASM